MPRAPSGPAEAEAEAADAIRRGKHRRCCCCPPPSARMNAEEPGAAAPRWWMWRGRCCWWCCWWLCEWKADAAAAAPVWRWWRWRLELGPRRARAAVCGYVCTGLN